MTRAAERLGDRTRRFLSSRFAFAISCAVYATIVLLIMTPVLGASIGSDDTYFTLASIAAADGSLLNAATDQLGSIFVPDTTGEQPRTVPLAIAARRILAVIVVMSAVTFGVPLAVVWSVAKVLLLLITLASVAALLRQLRFRGSDGEVRGIGRSTIVFVLLALPLAMALGVKAQSIGGLNGWTDYPVLTYGTVPVVFGTVALALWLIRRLEADYRAWFWPAVVLLVLVAVVLNYSYEFVAVAIPVAAVAIVLHPRSSPGSGWAAWKPAATVAVALVGVFTVLFLVNRWQLTTWPCVQDGTCYGGSVLQISPLTLWYNFVGALPSSVTPSIETMMAETGRTLPQPFTLWGAAAGLLAILSLLAALGASRAQRRAGDAADTRGLIVLLVLSGLTAIGVSVVSGITTRAIEWVQSPELPYRSGVAVWTCLALMAVIGLRMLLERIRGHVRWAVALPMCALVVAGLAHLLPLNLAVARAERATAHTQIVDAIHWDVVLGDLTAEGDATRCEHSAVYTSVVGSSEYYNRTLIGADHAFAQLYGVPYCSTPLVASESEG